MPAILSSVSACPTSNRSFPRIALPTLWPTSRIPPAIKAFAQSSPEPGEQLIFPECGGIPVATTAIGRSGAVNAALLAVSILSVTDAELAQSLADYRQELKEMAEASNADLI